MRRRKKQNKEETLSGDKQGWLLDVAEHEAEQEARLTKQCTGQVLFTKHRRVYDELVTALAGGASVRRCMKLFGVGTHTVLAIARREKLEVATRKAALANAMLLGAEVFAEVAIDLAPNCESSYEAAGTAKMLAETSNLMRGQATAITGVIVARVDAAAAGEGLRQKALKMGFGAGEFSAMRDVTPAREAQPVGEDPAPQQSAADNKSAAGEPAAEGNQETAGKRNSSGHGIDGQPELQQGGGGERAEREARPT